jgi:hypothetical protein
MDPNPIRPETNLKPADKALGPIPRGIEVLVKKAAVDPEFKRILLEKRASAADEISLKLESTEVAMINAVPAEQLETIIANTNVSEVSRAAFLGRAAAVMLAALGASTVGCGGGGDEGGGAQSNGIRPDRIPIKGEEPDRPKRLEPTDGARPDRPAPKEDPSQVQAKPLERPTKVRPTDGISPDRP